MPSNRDDLFDLPPECFTGEVEFERELVARGVIVEDGGDIEDAPNEYLAAAFQGTKKGPLKYYIAALLVDRGACCTASDCTACDEVRAYAVAWKLRTNLGPDDR